jgi:hypothetical protein
MKYKFFFISALASISLGLLTAREIPQNTIDKVKPAISGQIASHTEAELVKGRHGFTTLAESSADISSSETLMLPLIWNGENLNEAYMTSIQFTNMTSQTASVIVEFIDQNGHRAATPVSNWYGDIGQQTIVGGNLGPYTSDGVWTNYQGSPTRAVQARVTISPANSIALSGWVVSVRNNTTSLLGLHVSTPNFQQVVTNGLIDNTDNVRITLSNASAGWQNYIVGAYLPDGRLFCSAGTSVPAYGFTQISARDDMDCLKYYTGFVSLRAVVQSSFQEGFGYAAFNEMDDMVGSQVPNWKK